MAAPSGESVTTLEFWIPDLPQRALSSNGSHGNAFAVVAAKDALGESAYFAALHDLGPTRPQFQRADIYLDFHISRRKPQDGRYRFTDPSNGGGNVAKCIIDSGIVKAGLIPDDSHQYVRYFTTHITPVDTVAEEGVYVRVTEAEAPENVTEPR